MNVKKISLLISLSVFAVDAFAGPARANSKAPVKAGTAKQKAATAALNAEEVKPVPAVEPEALEVERSIDHADLHTKTLVRAHARRLAAHQTSIESHQSSLNSHQMSLDDHQDCLDALKPSVEDHEMRLDVLEPCVAQNKASITALEASVQAHELSLVDHEASIDELQECTSQLKASVADHEMRLDVLEPCVAQNKVSISALEASVQAHELSLVDHEASIDELQECTSQLKASVEAHEMSLDAHQESLDAHQASLDVLQPCVDELKLSVEDHQASLDALQPCVDDNKLSIDDLQSSVQDHQASLDALQPCVDGLKVSVADHQESLECHETRLGDIEACVADNKLSIDELQASVADQQTCIDDLKVSVDAHQLSLDDHQVCIDGLKLSVDAHQVSLEDHQVCIDDLKVSVADHEESLVCHQMSLDALAPCVADNKLSIDELQASVQDHEIVLYGDNISSPAVEGLIDCVSELKDATTCNEDAICLMYRLIGAGCLYKTIAFDASVTVGFSVANDFVLAVQDALSVYAKPTDVLLLKANAGVTGINDTNFKNLDSSMLPDGSPPADVVEIYGNVIINGDLLVSNNSTFEIFGDLTVKGSVDVKSGSSLCVHGDILFEGNVDQSVTLCGPMSAKGSHNKQGHITIRNYVSPNNSTAVHTESGAPVNAVGDMVFENNRGTNGRGVLVEDTLTAKNISFIGNIGDNNFDGTRVVSAMTADYHIKAKGNTGLVGFCLLASASSRNMTFEENCGIGSGGSGVMITGANVISASQLIEFIHNKGYIAMMPFGEGVNIGAAVDIVCGNLNVIVDCSVANEQDVDNSAGGPGNLYDYFTGAALTNKFQRDTSDITPPFAAPACVSGI